MECDAIRNLLPATAGGELTENERIAVEAHLGLCAECRGEAAKYRDQGSMLSALRDGDAPVGTFDSMWRRVREEVVPRRSASRWDAWTRAAAVLVIGVGIGYVFSAATGNSPVPAAAGAVASGARGPLEGGPESAGVAQPAGGNSATSPGNMMLSPRARLKSGRTLKLDGNHYLPRVEALLDPNEVDF